jgi:hypothetical protein
VLIKSHALGAHVVAAFGQYSGKGDNEGCMVGWFPCRALEAQKGENGKYKPLNSQYKSLLENQ